MIAPPCHQEIADRQHDEPAGNHVGHHLRAHAVGRGVLETVGIDNEHDGDQRQQAGDNGAGASILMRAEASARVSPASFT